MKKPNSTKRPSLKKYRSSIGLLLLSVLLIPFLVGFGYPDSSGTYAKVGVGGGRYRFTPGCGNTYQTDFQDVQVSVRHVMATDTAKSDELLQKLKPRHIAVGGLVNGIDKTATLIKKSSDSDSPVFTAADSGESRGYGYAVGATVGFDWRWVETDLGFMVMKYGAGFAGHADFVKDEYLPLPIYGLRLGDANLIYASGEFMEGSPISSDGGWFNCGIGGKISNTGIWAGYGAAPYEDGVGIIRINHTVGPVNVSATFQGNPQTYSGNTGLGDMGASVSLEYRLPH